MAPIRHPLIKLTGALVAIALVGAYFMFQARGVIAGPTLSIEFPQNGSTVNESLVNVVGHAPAAAHLSLNDRPIFTTPDGRFDEELILAKGYNVLSIEAKDRFGRSNRQTLELIYK